MQNNNSANKNGYSSEIVFPEEEIVMAIKTEPAVVIENDEETGECQQIFKRVKTEHLLKSEFMPEKETLHLDGWVQYKNDEELQTNQLKKLLSAWDLQRHLKFFEEQNITVKVLSIMSDDDISEVTQQMKIGEKILFKYHFQKWRAEQKLPVLTQNSSTNSQDTQLVSSPFPSLQSSSSEIESENSKIVLLDVLKAHKHGSKILEYYKKFGKITEEHRTCIVNLIVQHFESKDFHMSIQISYQLENQILQIFPTEKLEYYRTERRGKIYIKYYNKKKLMKSFKAGQAANSTNFVDEKNNPGPEDDAQEWLKRLTFDNLPADEYNAAWAACKNLRMNQIKNECSSIKEALNFWPQYKGPYGLKLIDSDFRKMYENLPSIISWENQFLNLFKYLKNRTNVKDPTFKNVLDSIDQNHIEKDKEIFHLKILWCLHYVLYPTKKFCRKNVNGKREYGRLTIRDSQESFIYINSTMQSLEDRLDNLINKGDPIQPFILGLGDQKSFNISNFFVYLDGHRVSFNSFHRAFDICFKSFHIFNVEYSLASTPFWIFIEKYLYNISKTNIKITKVSLLLNELSNMN